MKFIHADDIHLDTALAGLAGHEGAPLDLLRALPPRLHEHHRPDHRSRPTGRTRLQVGDLSLAIRGQSFRKADTRENLAASYNPVVIRDAMVRGFGA